MVTINNKFSPVIKEQVLRTLEDLLKAPLPSYAVLGFDLVVHDGIVKRLKIRQEIQVEAKE